MAIDIFETHHYRDYLISKVGGKDRRTGVKSRLAETLRCQASFLSQVLNGKAELTPEQAVEANRFFGHSPEEANFFILLVLQARAGSKDLRAHYAHQLREIQSRRLLLSKRLEKNNVLTDGQRSIYYSSWHYAAIHVAVTIPELRSKDALTKYFRLPVMKVNQVVDFLVSIGLLLNAGGELTTGTSEIFIGTDSSLILKHHANWRVQAIDSLDREGPEDLHYSGAFSLSRHDLIQVKKILMKTIQDTLAVIKPSKEEELCSFSVDLFSLRK